MSYIYPSSEYDSNSTFLSLLGEFWDNLHLDRAVQGYTQGRRLTELQTLQDLHELVGCAGRNSVPPYHTVLLYPFILFQSQRLSGDIPLSVAWLAPPQFTTTHIITSGITNPKATLVENIDFIYDSVSNNIIFRTDPFLNSNFEQIKSYDSAGTLIEGEIIGWMLNAELDQNLYNEQYGYPLSITLGSGQNNQDILNTYLDSIVGGTSNYSIDHIISLLTGVPLALTDGERVLSITSDHIGPLIITTDNIYRTPIGSNILVSVNDVLSEGDGLCDALYFLDIQNGQVPSPSLLSFITLDTNVLDSGIGGPISFNNVDEVVQLSTVSGFTKIVLGLGGDPTNVDQFWDVFHTKGIAAGRTLAMCLDTRTNPVGQPTAANLPATINPLQLLIANVLRYNTRLCVTIPSLFPNGADVLGSSITSLFNLSSNFTVAPNVVPTSAGLTLLHNMYAPSAPLLIVSGTPIPGTTTTTTLPPVTTTAAPTTTPTPTTTSTTPAPTTTTTTAAPTTTTTTTTTAAPTTTTTTTTTTAAPTCFCVALDGTGDYISGSDVALQTAGSAASYSLWYKTTAVNGTLFMYGTNASSQACAIYINAAGKLSFGTFGTNDNSDTIATNDGVWHHAMVINNTLTWTLYRDNISVGTPTSQSTNVTLSGSYFVGHFLSTILPDFNGKIRDVRAFNSAITSGNRTSLYNAGCGTLAAIGTETLWLKLTDNTGITAVDSSASPHNGTLQGNASWASDCPCL